MSKNGKTTIIPPDQTSHDAWSSIAGHNLRLLRDRATILLLRDPCDWGEIVAALEGK